MEELYSNMDIYRTGRTTRSVLSLFHPPHFYTKQSTLQENTDVPTTKRKHKHFIENGTEKHQTLKVRRFIISENDLLRQNGWLHHHVSTKTLMGFLYPIVLPGNLITCDMFSVCKSFTVSVCVLHNVHLLPLNIPPKLIRSSSGCPGVRREFKSCDLFEGSTRL